MSTASSWRCAQCGLTNNTRSECQACFNPPPPPNCYHFENDNHIEFVISYLLRMNIENEHVRQYSFEPMNKLIFAFTKCTKIPIKLAISGDMSECIHSTNNKQHLSCYVYPCKSVGHAIINDIQPRSNMPVSLIALVSTQSKDNPRRFRDLSKDALFKDYMRPDCVLYFAMKTEPTYFDALVKKTNVGVERVSCVYCQRFDYHIQEIAEWIGADAVCPYCDIDAVIDMNAFDGEIQVSRSLLRYWNKIGFSHNPFLRWTVGNDTVCW